MKSEAPGGKPSKDELVPICEMLGLSCSWYRVAAEHRFDGKIWVRGGEDDRCAHAPVYRPKKREP